ncbi:MAG TPA: hypothetical protein VKR83_20295 [Ktedonobacteraceae bacterium]|nr:hypothetical protein [Ktedonobacteraceae bacterium]
MKDSILIGRRDKIVAISAETWRKHLTEARQHSTTRLSFMTEHHHRVRNFVVRELPRNGGKPLRAEDISRGLFLPLATVDEILEELQKHLFFLVLNDAREVSWAFPVTTDRTPHRLHFSSGESIFAA